MYCCFFCTFLRFNGMMISGGFDGESGSETECSLLCLYQLSACESGCSIPGELLAADSSGKYLLIRKDAVSSRNLMPGTGGSTKQKEHYEGTILDIPD